MCSGSVLRMVLPGAHEPPKAAKERVTPMPSKYKFLQISDAHLRYEINHVRHAVTHILS